MTNLENKTLIEQMKKIDGLNKHEIISFIATIVAGLNLSTDTYLNAVSRAVQIYAGTEYKTFISLSNAILYLNSIGFTIPISDDGDSRIEAVIGTYTLGENEHNRPICYVTKSSTGDYVVTKHQMFIENNRLVQRSQRL